MVDINTVGAGGGSIAWFDRDGLLKVGPQSAGADPGPACYGFGGDKPTVSDANLILGRLAPGGLLSGKMHLDLDAAREAMAPIADRLGSTLEKAAHGIVSIAASNMVRAIRAISVERGHDPRDFVLLPFGGAGPLHATEVARALGMRKILVPFSPGILCAQGLAVSDLKEDMVVSVRVPFEEEHLAEMQAHLAALHAKALTWFEAEGLSEERREISASVDMRYVGQNYELRVPLSEGTQDLSIDVNRMDALRRRFFEAHDMSYGYHVENEPVEIINFRVSAIGRYEQKPTRPAPVDAPTSDPDGATRPVYFAPDVATDAKVYARDRLAAGQTIPGPAVVNQLDATTLIFPGDRMTVDDALSLIVEVTQ